MIEDEKIIEMFFERSEQGIRELDIKYGTVCHNLSYHIVGSRQNAEECVNDAYLGVWNTIPPARPNPLLSYVLKIVRNISIKIYWRRSPSGRVPASFGVFCSNQLWVTSRSYRFFNVSAETGQSRPRSYAGTEPSLFRLAGS